MIRQGLRRLLAFYDEMYQAPYRRIEGRAKRRKDDLFRLMVLSESLGVPNPAGFYTLELVPFMLEDFHEWHRRMGMEHSPLEGFRCC
ncbi:cory-CC-star protein [Salicola sp. Rm-C-2C1-2]|uniref:cory-CC-star protein n=1 Tax=Salicola sp. Rm-C-2C1-2 TaxID=3141321 RepID=UPI0032E52776